MRAEGLDVSTGSARHIEGDLELRIREPAYDTKHVETIIVDRMLDLLDEDSIKLLAPVEETPPRRAPARNRCVSAASNVVRAIDEYGLRQDRAPGRFVVVWKHKGKSTPSVRLRDQQLAEESNLAAPDQKSRRC